MSKEKLMERIGREFEKQHELNLTQILYTILSRVQIIGIELELSLDESEEAKIFREARIKVQKIALDLISKGANYTYYELWEAIDDCFSDNEKTAFKEALTLLNVL